MASQAFLESLLDSTKRLNSDIDAISAGVTRTATWPDEDVDIGALATETFVTNLFNTGSRKLGVVSATVGNIALTGLATQAGGDWAAALTAGDRVLVKDQTTGSENGIYVAAAGAWARAEDFDADVDVVGGASVYVGTGSTLADTGWLMITDAPVVGTDALVFTQFATSTVANASVTVAGVVELADNAETIAGTATGATGASLVPSNASLNNFVNSLVGSASGQIHLGTFTGSTIPDNSTVKSALQSLETGKLSVPATPADYTVANNTAERSIDPTDITLQSLARVVATMVEDNIAAGLYQ